MQPAAKLVAMANQIARNMAARGEDRAVQGIAEHIAKFWEPRMRAGLTQHFSAGGEGLEPLALKAAGRLAATEAAKNSA
jgi:formate dehydrogenase subunit delta